MHRIFSTTKRVQSGFTLIELMITVAIVAILAAIAIPSYQDSVWKGKRGEAKTAIMRTLQSEERYYTQNNSYLLFSTVAQTANTPFSIYSADNSGNSRYLISVEATTLTNAQGTSCSAADVTKCIRVVATVQGNADPKCGDKLSMDTVGIKQSAIVDAACWN